ncbi:hypothetical protein GCM10022223_07930 [Kineosporia mesophila]|uniref:Uncharacterized protein n=1 Tax=Kineosporia mesophila TaxID=566012 RepID=A0ABP6YZU9_9ACTN|nr:hypothetical protein [Kineosporia mesophila]MCD5351171.1 hypothetical protein [Kineosporia mesophila]
MPPSETSRHRGAGRTVVDKLQLISNAPPEVRVRQALQPPWAGRRQPVRRPQSFTPAGDGITRQLCSAIHLNASFGGEVLNDLVYPDWKAMAPNWHVDAVALARHAAQAKQRRETRDVWLLVVTAAVAIVLEVALVSIFTGELGPGGLLMLAFLVLLGSYLAGFAIIWVHYRAVHDSALASIGIKGLNAVEPPPLPEEIEGPIRSSGRANVVVFAGKTPFNGSGDQIDGWSFTVDTRVGTASDLGKRGEPQPFDSIDLHRYLLEQIPLTMENKPRTGHRLYVIGGHARAVGGLFRQGPVLDDPDYELRFRRPVSEATPEHIDKALRNQHRSARPYTFFEVVGWDGQVVVTLFVRVEKHGPMLEVEMAVTALRPLKPDYGDVVKIPLGPGAHRLPLLRTVLPMVWPLLWGSPSRTVRKIRMDRQEAAARVDLDQELEERNDLSWAAAPSLRDRTAAAANGNHFGAADEKIYQHAFKRRSIDVLREFLVEHDVDVKEFDLAASFMVPGQGAPS